MERRIESTKDTLDRLRERLRGALPGVRAQSNMAPVGRIPDTYDPTPDGAVGSAVLLVVTAAHELVFIRRAPGGAHSGQIAFPGGAREAEDRTFAETALREAEEEIGLPRSSVTLYGGLTPLYIPVSNFTVCPFVGAVETLPELRCQPGEVAEALVLRIDVLLDARSQLELRRDGVVRRVPCYRVGNVEIWGATAMIAAEFLALWQDACTLPSDLLG